MQQVVRLNETFEISTGENVRVVDAQDTLSVALVSLEDTRCPENVMCIKAGNVVAEIDIFYQEQNSAVVLHLIEDQPGETSTAEVTFGTTTYRVVLLRAVPERNLERDQEAERVALRLSKQ